MRTVRRVVALLLLAVAATASGYSFQGLSYSNSSTVQTGAWTCRYKLAKSLADKKNIPMVVVWVSPTCTYCKNLASTLGGSSDFSKWMAKRQYVMVFAVGQTTSETYGTTEEDMSAAYSYAGYGISKFPLVGIWWKKGSSGSEVKKRFSGRSGLMPVTSGGLARQFMDSVDQYVGAYAGGSSSVTDPEPSTPSTKTYKVTFSANGGSVSEKTRTIAANGTLGNLPTATRSDYRLIGWFTASSGGTQVSSSTVVTKSVTYYAQWKRLYTLSAAVSPKEGGKVTGTGSYASGEAADLKATAASGYVFAGWYSGSSLLAQESTYRWTMGSAAKSFTAKFIKKADDYVTVDFKTPVECETQSALTPIAIVAKGGSLPTVKVSALPSGLSFTDKDIAGHAANTIYGKPSKSGIYAIQVKAMTTGGAVTSSTLRLVARRKDEKIVSPVCNADEGSVKGGGVVAVGKKVTVKASPAAKHYFAGWFIDGTLVSQSSTFAYVVGDRDVTPEARFVTKEEDLAALSVLCADAPLIRAVASTNVIRCGVAVSLPIAVKARTVVSVSGSGIPAGLKLGKTLVNADLKEYAYQISGVPTTATKTDAKTGLPKLTVFELKISTGGGNTVVYPIAFVVEPLPSWASGTFSGFAAADESGRGVGVATLTVSKAGKISGKFSLLGTNWTYSANGYVSYDVANGKSSEKYRLDGVAKHSGLGIEISVEVAPGLLNCSEAKGAGACVYLEMHRKVWADKPSLPSPKLAKTVLSESGSPNQLVFSVSSSGTATFSGRLDDGTKVSCSSLVFVDEQGSYQAYLIVPASKEYVGYIDEIAIKCGDSAM